MSKKNGGPGPDLQEAELDDDKSTNVATDHVTHTSETSAAMNAACINQEFNQQELKDDSSDDSITEEINSSDSSDEEYTLNKEGFYQSSAKSDYKTLYKDSQCQLNDLNLMY